MDYYKIEDSSGDYVGLYYKDSDGRLCPIDSSSSGGSMGGFKTLLNIIAFILMLLAPIGGVIAIISFINSGEQMIYIVYPLMALFAAWFVPIIIIVKNKKTNFGKFGDKLKFILEKTTPVIYIILDLIQLAWFILVCIVPLSFDDAIVNLMYVFQSIMGFVLIYYIVRNIRSGIVREQKMLSFSPLLAIPFIIPLGIIFEGFVVSRGGDYSMLMGFTIITPFCLLLNMSYFGIKSSEDWSDEKAEKRGVIYQNAYNALLVILLVILSIRNIVTKNIDYMLVDILVIIGVIVHTIILFISFARSDAKNRFWFIVSVVLNILSIVLCIIAIVLAVQAGNVVLT